MINVEDLNLISFMEECAEATQAASKQLRFGALDSPSPDVYPNRVRLRGEILDIFVAIHYLEQHDQIDAIRPDDVEAAIRLRRDKIVKMRELSVSLGRLKEYRK